MSDREPLTPELKAAEAALASLVPLPATSSERDRVMFAAGRATVCHSSWVRGMALGLLTVAALVVGRWSAPQAAPTSPPHIAAPVETVPSVATFAAADVTGPTSYFQLRRHLDRLEVADVELRRRRQTSLVRYRTKPYFTNY